MADKWMDTAAKQDFDSSPRAIDNFPVAEARGKRADPAEAGLREKVKGKGGQSKFFDISALDMWYDEPAFDDSDPSTRTGKNWEKQAMMLGNGCMGALVYGGVQNEELNLNEKTLWQGGPGTKQAGETDQEIYGNWSKVQAGLPEIRNMLKNNIEVSTETAQNLLTNSSSALFREKHGAYQPLADMDITMDHGAAYGDYIRGLALDTATVVVNYTVNGVAYQREYFMSYPHNVLAARITAGQPGSVGFTLKLDGRQPTGCAVSARDGIITLMGSLQNWTHNENGNTVLHGNGMKYEAQAKVLPEGGTLTTNADGTVTVTGADSAVILFTAGTDYVRDYAKAYKGENPHAKVSKTLADAAAKSFEELRAAHQADYRELYNRVKLDIGQQKPADATDAVLSRYPNGSSGENRYVEALSFNFGRYLLIASSRSGSLPANLQGVWNPLISPQWESDYHLNINMQMNYWMSDVLNMPEVLEPVTDYLQDASVAGTATAKEMYGFSDGSWIMHNPMNPFGHTGLQFYSAGFWFPESSAWTLRQLAEHYAFTLDRAALGRLLPLIEGNVKFWRNYLVEDKDGSLICSPTCLPEQAPFTQAASMSQQIVLELLKNYLMLCRAAGQTSGETYAWAAANIGRVDNGLRVDEDLGIIRDWKYKDSQSGSDFRHLNQVYALYPSDGLLFETGGDSDLLKAAKTFLEMRTPSGITWSLSWRAALQARLQQGDLAREALVKAVADTYAPNMFSIARGADLFQIDGNLGYSAAVAEMLLQSHAGYIHVLPALPEAWASGKFENFVARGSFLVSAAWSGGVYDTITITARSGGTLSLKLEDMAQAAVTRSGQSVSFTPNSAIDGVYDLTANAGDVIVIKRGTGVHAAPTGVEALRDMDGNVEMTWNAVSGASGYVVRRYEGGRYTEMGTFSANSAAFADTIFTAEGATQNTSTQYVVSAVVNGVESRYSANVIPSVKRQ